MCCGCRYVVGVGGWVSGYVVGVGVGVGGGVCFVCV